MAKEYITCNLHPLHAGHNSISLPARRQDGFLWTTPPDDIAKSDRDEINQLIQQKEGKALVNGIKRKDTKLIAGNSAGNGVRMNDYYEKIERTGS